MVLGGILGMILYGFGILILAMGEWALSLNGTAGHPTQNDSILLLLGLVVSAVAGMFFELWMHERYQRTHFNAELLEYKRIWQCFDFDPQKAIDARLSKVATDWNEARLGLSQAQAYGSGETKADYQQYRAEIARWEKLMKEREQVFLSLYDQAQKVFGSEVTLKEKQIELYVLQKIAA